MRPIRTILLSFLLLPGFFAAAQKTPGRASGRILSEAERKPLSDATISLYRKGDSTVERMVITDNKGLFSIGALRIGDYRLLVTEVGHRTGVKQFSISETAPRAELGDIVLQLKSDSLEEVFIVRQKPPLVIKKDTLEFNASAFKTKNEDMTEDLLRKIPGLEVGRDGSLKANGQAVTQVLVDGKPFFGNDPRMATQNLPADIIDKVQVIDQKSEQARLTRVDDGQVDKVINITIKKEKKRGTFGRGYAGLGSAEHYESKATANSFLGDRKMSAVLTSNNIGRTDYSNGMNEDNSSYNSFGINSDHQIRANYTNGSKDKITLSVNGGWGVNENRTEQERHRINILGDSSTRYDEMNRSSRQRKGFSAGMHLQYRPDTLTSVQMNLSGNRHHNRSHSSAEFLSATSSDRKINEGSRRFESGNRSPSFNGNATFNRALKKKGRGIFLNLNGHVNNSLGDALNLTSNVFYPVNAPDYDRVLHQLQSSDNRSHSYTASLNYNDIISKKWWWTAGVSYTYGRNNTIREAFDYNPATSLYDLLNDSISTRFNTYTTNRRIGAGISYGLKKGTISFNGAWQDNRNRNVVLRNDSALVQRLSAFVPTLSYRNNSNKKQLSLSYTWDSRAPQPFQLQPVIDNTNPLYLRLGNPDLRFSANHRLNYHLAWFKLRGDVMVNVNGNFTLTQNAVVNTTTFDKSTGVQTSRPENRDGVYNGNTGIHVNKPFQWLGNRNTVSVNVNMNLSRNLSLINGEENRTVNFGQNLNTWVNLDMKDWGSVRLGMTLGRNAITYSLQRGQNNNTFNLGAEAGLRLTPNKRTDLSLNWNFTRRSGGNFAFRRPISLVHLTLNQYFNQKKNTWLKFQVYDLLRQNTNISRWGTEAYLEDLRTNGLTRFAMVSFNVKFNRFGAGKKGS